MSTTQDAKKELPKRRLELPTSFDAVAKVSQHLKNIGYTIAFSRGLDIKIVFQIV